MTNTENDIITDTTQHNINQTIRDKLKDFIRICREHSYEEVLCYIDEYDSDDRIPEYTSLEPDDEYKLAELVGYFGADYLTEVGIRSKGTELMNGGILPVLAVAAGKMLLANKAKDMISNATGIPLPKTPQQLLMGAVTNIAKGQDPTKAAMGALKGTPMGKKFGTKAQAFMANVGKGQGMLRQTQGLMGMMGGPGGPPGGPPGGLMGTVKGFASQMQTNPTFQNVISPMQQQLAERQTQMQQMMQQKKIQMQQKKIQMQQAMQKRKAQAHKWQMNMQKQKEAMMRKQEKMMAKTKEHMDLLRENAKVQKMKDLLQIQKAKAAAQAEIEKAKIQARSLMKKAKKSKSKTFRDAAVGAERTAREFKRVKQDLKSSAKVVRDKAKRSRKDLPEMQPRVDDIDRGEKAAIHAEMMDIARANLQNMSEGDALYTEKLIADLLNKAIAEIKSMISIKEKKDTYDLITEVYESFDTRIVNRLEDLFGAYNLEKLMLLLGLAIRLDDEKDGKKKDSHDRNRDAKLKFSSIQTRNNKKDCMYNSETQSELDGVISNIFDKALNGIYNREISDRDMQVMVDEMEDNLREERITLISDLECIFGKQATDKLIALMAVTEHMQDQLQDTGHWGIDSRTDESNKLFKNYRLVHD